MKKNLKKIIVILVIVILVAVGASFFLGGNTPVNQNQLQSLGTGTTGAPLTQNAVTSQAVMNTEEINREFLSVLLNLETIQLNDDIFSEPAFRALVDNTIRLNQPGNQGRPNPFAPIGIDQVSNRNNINQMETSLEASASTGINNLIDQNQEQSTASTPTASTTTSSTNTNTTPTPTPTPSNGLTDEEIQEALFNLSN